MVPRIDPSPAVCLTRVREILVQARARAWRGVNAVMVAAYWEIGREIVEEEQRGEDRAPYGKRLLRLLSARLCKEFGHGFGERSLRRMRQFYLEYSSRPPSIRSTVWTESRNMARRASSGGEVPLAAPPRNLPDELSWSHFRALMQVENPLARGFYEVECARSGWSVRQLERQIHSLLFQRLARSRDKEGVLALAHEGQQVRKPEDLIKDPYVLEFVGLPEQERWQEGDLEQALIDRLRHFLLELGSDLFFVARQKRLRIGDEDYYVDLVFYHRILRCFLLVDLKVGKLAQQDLGQMLGYLGWFEEHETREGEGPPVGLVLGTDKNDTLVRYTLARTASKLFAARYQLHLPREKDLARRLQMDLAQLESRDFS
ncbi:MAG: YhcG family protein [Planctomycetota bacterium]